MTSPTLNEKHLNKRWLDKINPDVDPIDWSQYIEDYGLEKLTDPGLVAPIGRATPLQGEGCRFESDQVHQSP